MSDININVTAVAGMGKTTVTALLYKFLSEHGFDVTVELEDEINALETLANKERILTVAAKSSITITQTQLASLPQLPLESTMKNLKDMITDLDEEISRVKQLEAKNGYHHGTAQNAIMRRYRTELTALARLMKDDINLKGLVEYDNRTTETKEDYMTTSYNTNNLPLVAFPDIAIIEIANLANKLGVLVHIDGIPFGDCNQSSRTIKDEHNED